MEDEMMTGGMGGMGSETVEVPVSMIKGAKVGESIELTVDSIDEKSGMAILSASSEMPEAEAPESGSAIENAAELFNQ